jgi:hypothetical protein
VLNDPTQSRWIEVEPQQLSPLLLLLPVFRYNDPDWQMPEAKEGAAGAAAAAAADAAALAASGGVAGRLGMVCIFPLLQQLSWAGICISIDL